MGVEYRSAKCRNVMEAKVDGKRTPVVHSAWDMLLMSSVYLYAHEGPESGAPVLGLMWAALLDSDAMRELAQACPGDLVPVLKRRGLREGARADVWRLQLAKGPDLEFVRRMPRRFLRRAHEFAEEYGAPSKPPITVWSALALELAKDPEDRFARWVFVRLVANAVTKAPFAPLLPVSAFLARLPPK